MTNWSNVEFASITAKSRKAQDVIPILGDLLAVWDFMACAVAGQTALTLYVHYVIDKPMTFSASGPFWRDIVFGSLIAALILRDPAGLLARQLGSPLRFVLVAERRCLVAFTILISVGMATRTTEDLARMWLVTWLAMFAFVVAGSRVLCGCYLNHLHGRGELREAIAIVGSSGVRDRLAARLANEADIVGTFCTNDDHAPYDSDDLTKLIELGRGGKVDSVILALDQGNDVDVAHLVKCLKALPVQVAVCPDEGWRSEAAPQMRLLGGLPMAVVADRPIKHWDLVIKTAIDKLGAMILIVILAPLLLATALAVGITSPGPIIFRQHRQGWCGREFVVFKFRTMRFQAFGRQDGVQTMRNDTRCTRVGRLLRRCSLDELPQLWNVLLGDMSLVGPRPHADSLHDVDRAGREIVAEYAQRNRVKPGITGWAQIHGARGATATLDQLRLRVEYDLFYIENWSLWLDIQILLRTPFAMTGENAF